MLKRFLCGVSLLSLLCGTVSTPAQAEEVYVRNRLFKDAYILGGTTYVPVDSFLRAVDIPWSVDGGKLVIGTGDSPEWTPSGDTFTATRDGSDLSVTGIVRDGRIYVPAKELAEFVNYKVIYNADTGIVDVVQGRLTSAADQKAAQDLAASKKAEKDARDAAWQARLEKVKADRKAKEDAENAEADSDDDEEDDAPLATQSDSGTDVSDTGTQSEDAGDTDAADAGPPPEADLVVLSTTADPNNYTGEVVFRAVLQNQGNARATDVKANLVVIGPDEKEWVSKTLYHGPMAPDARWEITDNYKHRLRDAIPRGNYTVTVTPTFKSEATQEK